MSDLNQRQASVIAPVIGFDSDIEIVSGSGSRLVGTDGTEYLDFACGIATTNLGHQHPGVTKAAHEQLSKVWHAGGVWKYESLARAGEAMRDVTPDGIEKFVFMNSGAEAVEGSVKLARKVSGRQGVIAFRGGFHGRTMGSVSYTTSKAKYRQGYHPLLPSVFIAPFPRPYRWGVDQETATAQAIEELHRMFKHEITPGEVAAFLVEPVQGEGGYYPADRTFLNELRRLSDEHGIMLILDEVQTGFGRTGEWFAADVFEVRPDIIVLGKGIANGLPLSAFGASAEVFDQWPAGSHGTTFGGNPVSCAAAAANVEGLRHVIPGVPALSEHAFARLEDIQESYRVVGDVRGLGLMIGIELVKEGREPDPAAFAHLSRYARDNGMFILSCGPDSNIIRFIPPLNISMADLDRGIDIIDEALGIYES